MIHLQVKVTNLHIVFSLASSNYCAEHCWSKHNTSCVLVFILAQNMLNEIITMRRFLFCGFKNLRLV